VLVTVAPKHGATGEIGEIMAGVLREAELEVTSQHPSEVANPAQLMHKEVPA
jgi:hypothetical protein